VKFIIVSLEKHETERKLINSNQERNCSLHFSNSLSPHGRPEWEYKEVYMPVVEAKLEINRTSRHYFAAVVGIK
jgi:hypothetical protein